MRVVVPIPLVNKANTYQIKIHPKFWTLIKGIVARFRITHKTSPYWIGPSEEALVVEEAVSYCALMSLSEDTEKPVRLEVWISDKLDADAIKVIGDGIQKSGRIKNDKQIKELTVHKIPIKNTEFKFDLTLI